MPEKYGVVARVISQKGSCAAGHKVGDEWFIKDKGTPEGMCIYTFHAIFPSL